MKSDFQYLDDSKEAKERKFLIFQEWEALLYGFDIIKKIAFINKLELTTKQIKDFSYSVGLGSPLGNKRKLNIIHNIVNSSTGHASKQLIRWLMDFKSIKIDGDNKIEVIG